jgi:hypothetical protein
VSRMFRHPSMLGHRAVGGDVYRDESGEPIQFTEPILTPGMVARADRVLRSRYVGPTQTKVRATSSLLSRLGSCHCGRNINHTTQFNRRKPNSKAIRYYYCRDCETTPRNRIQAEVLEDYVVTKALSYLAKLEPGSTVMDEVGKRWLHRYSPDQLSRREELADEADAVRGQLSTLRRNYYELKRIPADEFTSMETNLNRRLTGLEDEVEPLPGATKRPGALARSEVVLEPRVHGFSEGSVAVEGVPSVASWNVGSDVLTPHDGGLLGAVEALAHGVTPKACVAVCSLGDAERAVDAPETIGKLPKASPLEPPDLVFLPWNPCPLVTGSPTAWPGPGGAGLLGTGAWPEFSSLSPPPV